MVITASMASICGTQREKNPDHVWTEKDWNENPGSPYSLSKTKAERAAWEFIEKHPQLEITTIHPAAVFGPCFHKDLISSSARGHGLELADGTKKDGVAGGSKFGVVHIEDVSEIHILAMLKPEAKNQRYAVSSVDQWSDLKIAKIMKQKFPWLRTPETETTATPLLDVSSDCTKATSFLGRPLKTPESAIAEMVQSFIDLGVVPSGP